MFAWLSRRAGEGPGGVDPIGLVWTPSGPEMPRAPGRQELNKGPVLHLVLLTEASTLKWTGSWQAGAWPGGLRVLPTEAVWIPALHGD